MTLCVMFYSESVS